jgi:DnaJ-class molecular chaperone
VTEHEAFELFNISHDSDSETLKKRYHKLARDFHPDLGGCPVKMRELNDAYKVLHAYIASRDASKMYKKQSPVCSSRSFFITKDPQDFTI